MPTVEILNSHSVKTLRDEIAKSNKALGAINGYSKGLKKAGIIELMMKHKSRFHHIKMAEKTLRAPPLKSEKAKKKSQPAQQPAQQAKKIEPKKRVAKTATVIAPKKEEPKKEELSYNDFEKRFKKLNKLYVELSKGLNQAQLKSYNNDIREYIKLKGEVMGDTSETDIKNWKASLQKNYNKLYKIFSGKGKPAPKKETGKEKAAPKVKAGKVTPKSSDLKELEKSINNPSKKSLLEQLDELPDHPDAKGPKKVKAPKKEKKRRAKARPTTPLL